jgi:peptidoglycan/LPS O-acetylase OafA/YrhL
VIEFHVVSNTNMQAHGFETTCDALASGCLLAILQTRLHAIPMYRALQRSLAFVLVPIAVVGASALIQHPHVQLLAGITVANLGIALCIDWCIVHADGAVGRALNARPVAALGRISYSLYLWQELFLDRYSDARVTAFPINVIVALAVAVVAYLAIERPMMAVRPRVERFVFGGQRSPRHPVLTPSRDARDDVVT